MGVNLVSPGQGRVCRATGKVRREPPFLKLMEPA